MTGFSCAKWVVLSILVVAEATHTPSTTLDIPPEVRLDDEEQTFEIEPDPSMLRTGFDNYDLYDSVLPIPDIFKSILLEHQYPKRGRLAEDVLEYEDTDFLFDNPILDHPYMGHSILDNPFTPQFLGNPLLDSGTLLKGPLMKPSMMKRRPRMKRPMYSGLGLGRPMSPNPFKKRQSTREVEQLLKLLVPLFKNALGMRSRMQFAREGTELEK